MKLLAIDTSSSACSLALWSDGKMHVLHRDAPMQQAQLVLQYLDELLHDSKCNLKQLDAIAFGCGPGSFTGIRIATSVAQGLGFSLQIPLIPISSLAGLAQAAYDDLHWQNMIVAVDARIQEIYYGYYQANSKNLVELVHQEVVAAPAQMQIHQDNEWCGVGNAWEIYADQLPIRPALIDKTRLPMASGILKLAIPRYEKQDWVNSDQALPVYLRDDVAAKSNKR